MTEADLVSGADNVDMKRRLEEEVKVSLVRGKLTCPAAFKIAEKLKVPRKQVGDMANKLNIKISNCQLGCFP